jgi:hypothetical protein
MSEIKDFLSALKELDQTTGFELFIPSLQKEIKFKQLTAEQLKSILKTVVDSPIYNSQFITTFNSIIKENCLDEVADTNKLTIYDKLLILFKTRIESISSEFTFQFTKEEIKENNLTFTGEPKTTISLAEHFDNYLKNKHIFLPEVVEYGSCSLVCDLPTIETENRLEKELHKNVKIEVESTDELREIIGETFINELTKYISKITLGSKELDLFSLDFKNRVKVVEQLPTNIINKVLKYIESYRNKTKELTSIVVGGVSKDIPADASFFNM